MDSGSGDFGGGGGGFDSSFDDDYSSGSSTSKPKSPMDFKPGDYIIPFRYVGTGLLIILIVISLFLFTGSDRSYELNPEETRIVTIKHNSKITFDFDGAEYYLFSHIPVNFVSGYSGVVQDTFTVSSDGYRYYHRYLNVDSNIDVYFSTHTDQIEFLIFEGGEDFDEWKDSEGRDRSNAMVSTNLESNIDNFRNYKNTDYYFVVFNPGSASFSTSISFDIDATKVDLSYASEQITEEKPDESFKEGSILVIYNPTGSLVDTQFRYRRTPLWITIWTVSSLLILLPTWYTRKKKYEKMKLTSIDELTGLSKKARAALISKELTTIYQLFNLNYHKLVDLGIRSKLALEINNSVIAYVRSMSYR